MFRYLSVTLVLVCSAFFQLLTVQSNAQVFNSYNFPWQISTGVPLDNMAGATNATFSDVTPTGLISFGSGFTFWYAGVNYTGLSMSPDGWVRLGAAGSGNPTANFNTSSNYPILAPYWTDLQHLQPLKYKMTGTAPNRIFIVSWVSDGNFCAGASFQLWLHETTGQIDFVYGTVYSNTGLYSIGHGAMISNQRTFINLITDTFAVQTLAYYNYAYNGNTLPILSGTCYSFIPVMGNVTAPQNLQFSNVSAGCLSMGWQDASLSETYFKVLRSTDNINYTLLKTIPSLTPQFTGTVYQFSDTDLVPQTQYFYKVIAYSFCSSFTDSIINDTITAGPSLQGIKTIPGDFASITEAFDAIKCQRLSGPLVLELQSNYSDSGEIFPLRINKYLYTSTVNTLTIRPAANAAGLSIRDSVPYLVEINNAQGITLDGRPGGTGNQQELTLQNNSTSGVVITMLNDAKHEQLLNLNILGSSTNVNSGSIVIGTTNMISGNDSILIDSCRFTCPGTGMTANHIYAKGTAAKPNEHITISYCNFSGFGNNTLNANDAAIMALQGNDDWLVTGNSFFTDRSIWANGNIYGVRLKNSSAQKFRVTGNYFGGSAPFCSASPMDFSPKAGAMVYVAAAPAGHVYIDNNVFRNIAFYLNAATNGGYTLIEADTGTVWIHDNAIGRMDTVNDVVMHSYGSQALFGISVGSPGKAYIYENQLAGISQIGFNNGAGDLLLIDAGKDSCSVYNNSIGSPLFEKSILCTTSGDVYGITGSGIITGNTICHYWKESTVLSGYSRLYGIKAAGGSTVSNNKIWGFYTTAVSGNPIRCIELYDVVPNVSSIIRDNEIYDIILIGTPSTNQYNMAIEYDCASNLSPGKQAIIERNFIHNMYARNNSLSDMCGINVSSGPATVRVVNNMISLGYDENGVEVGSGYSRRGITVFCYQAQASVLFNSIYIGGHDSIVNEINTGIGMQYGTNNDSILNNIVCITRVRTLWIAQAGHIPITLTNTNVNSPVKCDYNLYYTSDPQAGWSPANPASFTSMQSQGYDQHSLLGLPNFINPAGDTQTVDLHLFGPSPAEGAGIAIASVQLDIDYDLRATFSPTDIGADAGNFFITGVYPDAQSTTLQAYPNPVEDLLTVVIPDGQKKVHYRVCNALGEQLIDETADSAGSIVIDFQNFSAGIFFVQVEAEDQVSVVKIVKN